MCKYKIADMPMKWKKSSFRRLGHSAPAKLFCPDLQIFPDIINTMYA